MRKRVLITDRLPDVAYQSLSHKYDIVWNNRHLTETQLASKIRPFHALLTTLADPVTEKVLASAPNLQCISNYAVGYNNIDLKAAKARNIWVTNTPNVLTEATADIAWALLLSCARRLPEGVKMVWARKFKGWQPRLLLGIDLVGKTLGLYGFGRIGKAVAQRGRAWNMRILYHQRRRENRRIEKHYRARYVSFEDLLRYSDFLSVHAPLTPETRNRFTLLEFRKMKSSAIFINTARGPLHSEKDLANALQKGLIRSAGLDVYEFEPKVDAHLLRLPNCTLLPHLGSATVGTRNSMALLAAENIDLVLSGKLPKTPVFHLKETP